MKTAMVLITGAMFASLTLAAGSGPAMEEQYRAKYGVYPPWYRAQVSVEETHGACCDRLRGQDATTVAEERSRTKFGHALPAAERKQAAARVESARHQSLCAPMVQCKLTPAEPVVTAMSGRDAQRLAKYGQVMRSAKPPMAAANVEACEHACCQGGE
jgi:hypothetical protein